MMRLPDLFRRKPKQQAKRTPIDTLFIVGNGFDLWQGLHSNFSEFQTYYLAHRDEILKKLRIKKRVFIDQDRTTITCSDVELIYGDPFCPDELDYDFWNSFEASLGKMDAERLNLFFGKEKNDLKEMERSVKNAKRILREAFCGWVAAMNVDGKDSGYSFGENCLFVNFNYTDTLIKRFGVKGSKEFHIHGEAADKESIIFGHAQHPQEPEYALARFGGRFLGLFFVDKALYETDKNCRDNIQMLIMFLALHQAMCEEIKDIYVLGHSMGPADLDYFDFLIRSTQVASEREKQTKDIDAEPLDDLYDRLQYGIQKTGYGFGEVDDEYEDAVNRRFRQEQDARDAQNEKEFMKILGKHTGNSSKNATAIDPRTEDAKWHVSYHSEKDRLWEEAVLKKLGCRNYELYPSIDECLRSFRK